MWSCYTDLRIVFQGTFSECRRYNAEHCNAYKIGFFQ